MKIGILGSGDVARTLGSGFLATGHDVKLGARKAGNPKLVEWAKQGGPHASQGTFSDAAQFGDLIVVSTLGVATAEAVRAAGLPAFRGKLVIDTTNPLRFSAQGPPSLAIGLTTSAGEELQQLLPQAHVVKAFNIIGSPHMFRPSFPNGPPDMWICGNDAAAKEKVKGILKEFGWSSVIDLGGIENSRELESLCVLWVKSALVLGTWNVGFRLLRRGS